MEYRRLFNSKSLMVAAVVILLVVLTTYNSSPELHNHPVAYSRAGTDRQPDEVTLPTCSDSGEDKNCMKSRLPKCLIIGFAKCGTYSLIAFLAMHPDIVTAKREIKFFNENYDKGLNWYAEQMPPSGSSQITIEKTPGYILSKTTLDRIHEYNSSIKLIVIVRDPVIRLPSSYAHQEGKRNIPSFPKWFRSVNFTDRMNYFQYISVVYKVFPKDQILVLCEEQLEDDPLSVMRDVEQFLGIRQAFKEDHFIFNEDKGFYCFNTSYPRFRELSDVLRVVPATGCFSNAKGRVHPDISPALLREMASIATKYNEQLFALIGKRFNWTEP
ncbi:heparan sulfate glucosamine 3-O-sulfotransferase 1 [Biomphalaria glabrata]|uniref:Heparan sulfate glucosamine 3-O-sulfotransferase 1-like n=1 Tax=Biomphalaria glabrata TaxID=6526 RepID=A0A2C9JPN3_BIOGL|nr:heparan sulfate glucosamine 3-O-sulfotransferase 1-like [Biomphalaria glabrata]KAI8754642.1 heparan sulfate glucosamine 3-O-sulfotransferase 1-like [Biomphalaria glabrata]KAI8773275.1 heparan sulfate glucosamine 3-O-sulfotransferase 1 [Biomphalaria glabrata]